MITNKEEIKAYYELNDEKAKAISEKFKVNYRTLMHWIKSENWQRAKCKQAVQIEVLQDDLLKKELGTIKDLKARQIKQSLRENLSENGLDDIILNNLLDASQERDTILKGVIARECNDRSNPSPHSLQRNLVATAKTESKKNE